MKVFDEQKEVYTLLESLYSKVEAVHQNLKESNLLDGQLNERHSQAMNTSYSIGQALKDSIKDYEALKAILVKEL